MSVPRLPLVATLNTVTQYEDIPHIELAPAIHMLTTLASERSHIAHMLFILSMTTVPAVTEVEEAAPVAVE